MGASEFVVNTIVVWNTRYMKAALDTIQENDVITDKKDIQRLSSIGHEHITIVERYSFHFPEEIENRSLRPLIKIERK
ncbi:Tn3 family transposase [Bacillus sp. FSL R12-0069]|uniref:Tn3 family transposase n=1 Tax=Bacillus sp. FSL R12-0069 TaxID=2975342 RepID=UPI0030FC623E